MRQESAKTQSQRVVSKVFRDTQIMPLPVLMLRSVCPAYTAKTFRHAYKVRCPRCGFMWDCSEL